MIYYVTYNEPFNGIFNSQVIDVVKHLRNEHYQDVRLISFLPIGYNMSNYRELVNKLKSVEPNCIIIPTVPVQYGWKFNWFLLLLAMVFRKRGSIISREVQATYISIICRNLKIVNKVCYDARGANYAQMKEYDIYSENIKKEIFKLESYVLHQADFRLAVSHNLVEYWRSTYNYVSKNQVVIPCTISEKELKGDFEFEKIKENRQKYNYTETDVVLVFSGSNFGWQSFELIKQYCELQLNCNSNIKIAFLSKPDEVIDSLFKKYPDRVSVRWLNYDEVFDFLEICDYGILLRESNDTNNVSSPTKFAEYLAAGLPVIVSENLEFSRIVKNEDCGIVINNDQLNESNLIKTSNINRRKLKEISAHYFLKSSLTNKLNYDIILTNLIGFMK